MPLGVCDVASQESEASKREKFEKELKMLNEWAATGAEDGEACGWLCEGAGEGRMTLADIAYFPFLERIDATLEKFKVRRRRRCCCSFLRQEKTSWEYLDRRGYASREDGVTFHSALLEFQFKVNSSFCPLAMSLCPLTGPL